jgi:hypothetical protein
MEKNDCFDCGGRKKVKKRACFVPDTVRVAVRDGVRGHIMPCAAGFAIFCFHPASSGRLLYLLLNIHWFCRKQMTDCGNR